MAKTIDLKDMRAIERLLTEKFLRYVTIDTQSKEDSDTYPSTAQQWDLLKLLLKELKKLGIKNCNLDQHGYLTAHLASNLAKDHAAFGKVATLAFIAHVDTAPGVNASKIKPQVIKKYAGGNISLPGDKTLSIRTAENPCLANNIGKTIITSDGTTLLGADDKCGVAIIMTLLEFLRANPKIPHGDIKIAFLPDEEVGAGTKYFDLKKFAADFAYSIDGNNAPELNYETFSANTAIVTVSGIDIHPGSAKNIMVNSIRIISDLIAHLPPDLAPETTDGYDPYLHPYVLQGSVAKATIKILLRHFETKGLKELQKRLQTIIEQVQKRHPKSKIELNIIESYRNMRPGIEKDRRVIDYLEAALHRTGLRAIWQPIRGGTDGASLTAKGLPTPNIFTGSNNHHSKTEWASVFEMRKALETIVNLVQIWVEKANFGKAVDKICLT